MCEKTRAQNLAATHLDRYLKWLNRLIEKTPFDSIDLRIIELSRYHEWLEQMTDNPDPELSFDATIDLGNQ